MVIGSSGDARSSSWRYLAGFGLLGALAGFACEGESVSEHASGGSAGADAGEGGTAGGGPAGGGPAGSGQGGAAARGGANPGDGGVGGGPAGAGSEGGDAGAAGAGAVGGNPSCHGNIEADDCPYPESRGKDGTCGVTPNAWYPIGDSAPDWPERGATASRGLALHAFTLGYGAPYPQLALHETGRAAVTALCEVFDWDGGTWQWRMAPHSENYALDGCGIAIDRIGQPLFIYWHGLGASAWRGYAERLTATGWDPLPGPFRTIPSHDSGAPTSVTFDAANAPHLAWKEFYNDESEINAVRFDETSELWEPIGPPPVLYGGFEWYLSPPELSQSAGGELAILTGDDYDEQVPHVLEWNGDEWLDRADPILDFPGRRHLTHDDTGAPVVFVAEDEELLLFRWSGTQWDALEPDEATLGTLPELVRFDAWTADDQVYVRRFSHCGWTELSASARVGGVSNTPAGTRVFGPSLAVSNGRVCVAWTEDDTDPVVLIRCHDLPSD